MIKVSQRTKRGPVIITGTLPLASKQMKMNLKGPVEACWELIDLFFDSSSVSKAFDEAIHEITTFLKAKKPRGALAGSAEFTENMKRYCAYVYWLCDYWLKKPKNKWPDPIKKAVALLETPIHKRPAEFAKIAGGLSLISSHAQNLLRPTSPLLTAFFAEKHFHNERDLHYHKLRNKAASGRAYFGKWTDNIESFRRTFITNNKRNLKHYKTRVIPMLLHVFRGYERELPFDTNDLESIFELRRKLYGKCAPH